VDPGSHVVSASAPGKRPWQAKIDITQGPAQKSVQIPKLVDAPTAAVSASGTSPSGARKPQGSGKMQRMGAYALGGVGVVGIGVGSFFGLRAISKNQQSNDAGCVGNQCPADAAATRRSAASAGNVSTIAFIVGGVALAGGVTLYLTAPSSRADDKPASAQASLALTAGFGSLGLSRTW
jgi:hypothetical protein